MFEVNITSGTNEVVDSQEASVYSTTDEPDEENEDDDDSDHDDDDSDDDDEDLQPSMVVEHDGEEDEINEVVEDMPHPRLVHSKSSGRQTVCPTTLRLKTW
mmetsp:Transcript_5762/g.8676  ORF Transcript_5762/g.8676 Transcript_5762/m.8676 type:complete len:101 (-) Transcript_5762:2017-2319(-)